MNCPQCGDQLDERKVNFCACDISPAFMIEDVPAQVCNTCGEQVFSDETIAAFERVKENRVPVSRTESLNVYRFADALDQEDRLRHSA